MGYYIRVLEDGTYEVCETQLDGFVAPPHKGKIWLVDGFIHLVFPPITNMRVAGQGPFDIAGHELRLSDDEIGMRNVEKILSLRRNLMKAGNEDLLLSFAKRGGTSASLVEFYKQFL